ncbi:MAG: HD-GYP domain-containing protein [Pseudodesulfovibrio sp.]
MMKKLDIEDLRPGMEVVKLSSEIWEHLPSLYNTAGVIQSQEQVTRIQEDGYLHAFIEIKVPGQSLDKRLDAMLSKRKETIPEKPREPFEKEIAIAQLAYENAMVHARRIVNDAKLGRKVDYESTVATVDAIVDSAVRNPDTLICLSKLSLYDDYTYGHCINVSAISVVFGEFLGMGKEELTALGIAGMMHDLGKTAVPERIINKRARLSDLEFEEIKRHPQYGADLLKRQGDVPDNIIEAVRDHHEKFNGNGYPDKRNRSNTSAMARIISLADVYDALTSKRAYKDAILPNKALAIMYGMRDQDFDPLELQMFIKCLGIFPSGSLVKLNNGFYGVVYESNPNQPLMPKIKIILDQDLHPVPSELVDMAAQQAVGKDNLEILECADASTYKVNLKPYLTRRI